MGLMGFAWHQDSSCALIDPYSTALSETGRTSLDVDGMPLAWRIFLLRTNKADMTATKLVGDAKSAKFSPPKFQNLLRQESWISVDNLLDRSLEYRHRGAAGVATRLLLGLGITDYKPAYSYKLIASDSYVDENAMTLTWCACGSLEIGHHTASSNQFCRYLTALHWSITQRLGSDTVLA